MRTDLAQLLERLARKSCPKTVYTTYGFSEQFSEETVEEEILIPDRAVFETFPFHLKFRSATFGQLEVTQSSHCAFARLLEYCYYRLVNA